jgi:hypothetical protein
MTLDRDDVEAIAVRVAELLRPKVGIGLVGVEEVVMRLGVSRSYVYEHADELGGIRLGDGPKARLRFDLTQVLERFSEMQGAGETPHKSRARPRPAPASGAALPPGVKLIQGRRR